MRFIDRFQVILLDMARTFMFGVDRFSETEDYAATYRRIRGKTLAEEQVQKIITSVFAAMSRDYDNPAFYDDFPSVRAYMDKLPEACHLSLKERAFLEHTFAVHELGRISDAHADVLRQLAKTHQLGVVSNIFSTSQVFLREFERVGIRELFNTIIFSSDQGPMKPAPALFLRALQSFSVDRSAVVFVGDSLRHDIAGAQSVGLATVWIDHATGEQPTAGRAPDRIIHDIQELLTDGERQP